MFFSPIVCVGRVVGAVIATILITLSAKLLEVVGLLFNWLVYYTIVAFGDQQNGFLTTDVRGAIDTAWTVFRDLSNILIIGLFVFIAISIILGLESFGQKKMIARVLVIAVLMNFSLLFTKLIIDASNFVSYQFYTAAGGSVVPRPINTLVSAGASAATTQQQDGIAGQFIRTMGVTGIGDVYTKIRANAEKQQDGILALLHGVLSATFLLGVAIVMLYGCLLIVSRAVLLVFLMITSSIAFATYLIPKAADSQYGWTTWWKSLINVAIFGPLLMILLWITLLLAQEMATQNDTLGGLMTSSDGNAGVGALFNYVILLGMLFASFKIASSFSSGISGFNFAAMVPALGLAAGARVAAFAGRHTFGRASLAASDAARLAANQEGRGRVSKALLGFGARALKGVAKSDMNAMRSPFGSVVANTAGMKLDALTGKALKGYEGTLKARADKFAKRAEDEAISDAERDKMKKEVLDEIKTANPDLDKAHKTSEEAVEAATRGVAKATKEQVEAVRGVGEKIIDLQKQHTEALHSLGRNPSDQEQQARARDLNAQIERARSEHKDVLREQDNKIKEANKALTEAKAQHAQVTSALTEVAKQAGKWSDSLDKKASDRLSQRASEMANDRLTNLIAKAAGISSADNDRLAKLAGKQTGERKKQHDVKEAMEHLKHIAGGDDHKEDHGAQHGQQKKSETGTKTQKADSHDDHGGSGAHH